ncbi:hypothetical protein Gotri_016109 [Gossypium trilobum]|uniref:Retrotransposon gag domain-containing protein n=1 Tax=Gossypium trilobum TaxID=34281 RepID=A0A7J9E2L6_9ROSI|nr:hypothetical protein [Gossypium trilobum]
MLSAVEECVGKLEESMEDAKESDNVLGESIGDLRDQFRDIVTMYLTSQRDNVQELLDSQRKKLTERNDALEAMVMALKVETMATTRALSTRIDELQGELALYLAVKELVGTRSACDVDNFLWRMENYFRAKGIVDDAIKGEIGTWQEFQCELKGQFYLEFTEEEAQAKLQGIMQRGTVGEYVREFKELMLQVSDVTEKEALLVFKNGLKSWVRQEVEQRAVQKL